MTNPSHSKARTAGPWHVFGTYNAIAVWAGDWMIADCTDTRPKFAAANAAFIVTACNAHDDLVAVLKSVVGVFEGQEDVPRYVQKARAALASLPAPQVRG